MNKHAKIYAVQRVHMHTRVRVRRYVFTGDRTKRINIKK